jgi:hypothetical protein
MAGDCKFRDHRPQVRRRKTHLYESSSVADDTRGAPGSKYFRPSRQLSRIPSVTDITVVGILLLQAWVIPAAADHVDAEWGTADTVDAVPVVDDQGIRD